MTARISPLAAWKERLQAASGERFSIRELPFLTQIGLRDETNQPPNTWSDGGDHHLLWLGADELLITADDARREKLLQRPGAIDVSASRAVLELSGADARSVLAKGCTLDLHGFRAPQCAQTLLARTQVLLQAMDGTTFRVFVRISFAHYLADWLLDAAAETRASYGLDAERIAARLA